MGKGESPSTVLRQRTTAISGEGTYLKPLQRQGRVDPTIDRAGFLPVKKFGMNKSRLVSLSFLPLSLAPSRCRLFLLSVLLTSLSPLSYFLNCKNKSAVKSECGRMRGLDGREQLRLRRDRAVAEGLSRTAQVPAQHFSSSSTSPPDETLLPNTSPNDDAVWKWMIAHEAQ